MLRIGVIGGHLCEDEVAAVARRVGELVAWEGAALVCGGLGGVMEAAAVGARDAGGVVVGILPGDDVRTARNVLVVKASDAVIAIAGGWGTMSEAALCLKLGVPLIRLKSDLTNLPVPEAETPEEAVVWALDQARTRGELQ